MPRKPPDPQITRRQAETARAAIQTSKTIQKLQEHLQGKIKLDSSQVQAARILLNKVLADKTSIEQIEPEQEPPTIEEIAEEIAEHISMKVVVAELIKHHPDKAVKGYELLGELLGNTDNIVPLKAG